MNLYDKLGVAITATKKEIKTAFKKISSKCHPDKGGNAEEFKELQKAYSVLSNDENRDHYDKTGDSEGSKRNPDNVLLQAFASIIENMDFKGNIIENITESLTRKINQLRMENIKIDSNIKKLEKQKGRISSKNENFFELILNESIQNQSNKKNSNLKAINDFEGLIESVSNYSDERPEEGNQPYINQRSPFANYTGA